MIVVFDPSNGQIQWTLDGAITLVELETSVPEHLDWMFVNRDVDVNEDYVADGAIEKRPRMAVTWQYDPSGREVVIKNIPSGAQLVVPNWQGIVNDGFVIWPVVEPGIYPITLECFPYHSEVIRAEVT
ncbi:hypothetical protein ACL7TT_01455 [Microbulbifer sp. 2304DJ12-6]|uniref:hypothetical protein n=1 Tax=Microbulbifer sp. 2304DJ12-6 TaxID=3233340 RepID=UPI0039B0298F